MALHTRQPTSWVRLHADDSSDPAMHRLQGEHPRAPSALTTTYSPLAASRV